MRDDDDIHDGRDPRDSRPFGTGRRSRAQGAGLDILLERVVKEVASLFEEEGRGRSVFESLRRTRRDPHARHDADDVGHRSRNAGRDADQGAGPRPDPAPAADPDAAGGAAEASAAPVPSMRGRGPKNYRRSDARLAELVNDALLDDERLDATDIEVSVSGGEVTLAGHVGSREDKHRAEDVAAHASGVDDIDNRLRVHRAGGDKGGGGSSHPGGLPGEAERDADDYGHP